MKPATFLILGLFGLAAVPSVSIAIPQQIGTFGLFAQAAGAPVEEFFRDPAKWQAGAKIPGPWKEETTGAALENPGIVLGLPADHLTAVRSADHSLTELVVRYSAKGAGVSQGSLLAKLKTNAGSFLGSRREKKAGDTSTFEGVGLVVQIEKVGKDHVTARITRAISGASGSTASK